MLIEQTLDPDLIADSPVGAGRGFFGEGHKRLAVCGGLLALLMAWAVVFPQTGDGDAIMHYLNAHDSLWQPAKLMGSWARVGSKIDLLIPAQFGVLGARWMAAVVSILCAWQTIRLAEDLGMENAVLAGPFLIFQPFVFGLAGDTMTELPFALGVVVAIRLWMKGRISSSCWVMGYLPTVRPEGFFLCALWGAMLVAKGRPKLIVALAWGTAAWMIGCWVLWGDPMYCFRAGWAWPADSLRVYGRGSFFAYLNRWPVYCGPVSLGLFLVGGWKWGGTRGAAPRQARDGPHAPLNRRYRGLLFVGIALVVLEILLPSSLREVVLPWPALGLVGVFAWKVRGEKFAVGIWAFLLIFTLHTVLWWRGWFGSCGLMRILACVSPITAIVCLRGWNVALARAGNFWRVGAVACVALTAMVYYLIDPLHQRIFPLERACEFVARNDLLRGAPMIVFGDPMAQAALKMRPNPPNLLMNDCDRNRECARLLHVPIGSVGLWDNQHAQAWFGVSIGDLAGLGYSVLFRTEREAWPALEWLEPANSPREQVYVVIRKVSAGELPATSSPRAHGF